MGDTKNMRGFVNPYNFICFPKEKAHAYADEDRHTGVIHYTITTKTPLFIPNSSSETALRNPEHRITNLVISFLIRNWIRQRDTRMNIIYRSFRAAKCVVLSAMYMRH